MDEGFAEFQSRIVKRNGVGKKCKVRGSWGVYNAYKKMRKNGWYDIGRPLKEKEFYAIIRGVNDLLAKEVANGNTIVFPHRMGFLELRKFQTGVSIVKGKLKNTYPIDWNKTIRLWYEDQEAYRDKLLLRDEQPWVYHVKYSKANHPYENNNFYQFVLNRKIKVALKQNINSGKIDTLW